MQKVQLSEYLPYILSLLALGISLYSAVTVNRNKREDVKIDLLRHRLDQLERSVRRIHDGTETADFGQAVYYRFTRVLEVASEVTPLLPRSVRLALREEQRRVNDSYVRAVGEKKGLQWADNPDGLYSWNELPQHMAKFCSDFEVAISNEIDSIQDTLARQLAT